MPTYDVVTFGETMIRLSPPGQGRLEAADSLDFRIGGSESNTAMALARLGRSVAWWSKLPETALGRRIAAEVGRWGVDTSHVRWTPTGRVGIYFIEFGSPPRPHQVTYDRAGSAASTLTPDEIDWTHFDGARHLHVTGITAALSDSCAATVDRAIQEAKSRHMTVSFDVNYRSKLWSAEKARSVLTEMLGRVDLLFCPLGDADAVFGIKDSPIGTAKRLQERLGVYSVVVTGSADHVGAVDGEQTLRSEVVRAREVDRVGAGDAGDAGILHGYLDGNLALGLRYGSAMAALKQSIPGDELIVSREEIEAVVQGVSAGIQR